MSVTNEVVSDLPFADYLNAPGLSASGARKLLPPSCPALFKWEKDHPQEPSEAMDIGSAVHQHALGDPEDRIVVVDAASWQGKAARSEKEEARAAGLIPILAGKMPDILGMANAVKTHPLASRLFSAGKPEASLFWTDPETGIECKCRLDWLPDKRKGHVVFADLKTSNSADPGTWAKSAADYGYAQQAANNLDGIRALGLAEDPEFMFAVVEKRAPYLITIARLDPEDLIIGDYLNRKARRIYADCLATEKWPAYSEEVETVGLPGWYRNKFDEAFEMEIAV